MPIVNQQARELVFKIVYSGPGLSGKTTSLQHIHATTRPEHRGKLISLATPVDRTLYFDFLPIRLPTTRELGIRLQLFTVPGQVHYNATRKLVLTGADGVVFVADSRQVRLEANAESLRNLEENLGEHGRSLTELPHVLMYNKRDLAELTDIEQLEQVVNPHGAPSFAAVASSGEGVYEALEAITRAVLEDFERRMPEHHELLGSSFAVPEGGLMEALRGIDDGFGLASEPPLLQFDRGTRPGMGLEPRSADSFETMADTKDVVHRSFEGAAERAGGRESDSQKAGRNALAWGVAASDGTFEGEETPSRANLSKARSSLGIEIALSGFGEGRAVDGSQPTRDVVNPTRDALRVGRDSAGPNLDAGLLRGGRGASRGDGSARANLSIDPRVRSSLVAEASVHDPGERSTARSQHPPFSLCPLFRDGDAALVGSIEAAISTGDTVQAVMACGELVERSLAQATVLCGQEGSSPAEMALLLGIDRAAWLEFGVVVRRVKSQGVTPSHNDALCCLLLAASVQRGLRRLPP